MLTAPAVSRLSSVAQFRPKSTSDPSGHYWIVSTQLEDYLESKLQLSPRCCRWACDHACSARESAADVIDLSLCAGRVGEVSVVGYVEGLHLELCPDALCDRLVLHETCGPEKESWTIEGVATAGAEARSIKSGSVRVGRGKCKAGCIDVVEFVTVSASTAADESVWEVEG